MNNAERIQDEMAHLRSRAEELLLLKSPGGPPSLTENEAQRLVHELEVHRIELEMQNAELLRARDEAEKALERYEDLYDFAPVGYLTIDRNGIVRAANLTCAGLLGIERSQLIGRRITPLLSEQSWPVFDEIFNRALSSGDKQTCEALFLRGNRHPLPAHLDMVADMSGKECRLAVVDISERRRMEDELRRANDEMERKVVERSRWAEEASRAKSRFLANMSHELRTPMTGVLGMLEIAQDWPLEPQQRDCIDTAIRSGRILLNILNDILDFSKIEEGKLSVETVPFSIPGSMTNVVDLLTPEARRKGIELSLSLADDLPDTVVGDQLRLQQVLANLIGNAIKFTRQGKVTVEVTGGDHIYGNRREITFTVTDTGIGIPVDKQKLLFLPFSQVDDSHTRQFGGTGLGLAISRDLVEQMGGKIACESEEGKGSRFSITVPFDGDATAGAKAQVAAETAPVAVAPPPSESGARPHLLIAEDDDVTRKVFGLMLKQHDFVFDFVANGREAVEMCGKREYDLIVMDVQMPVMDGFEATAAIRSREKEHGGHVPILAMTAHALKEDEDRCLAAGMDGYLSKPINFNKCIELIRGLING